MIPNYELKLNIFIANFLYKSIFYSTKLEYALKFCFRCAGSGTQGF